MVSGGWSARCAATSASWVCQDAAAFAATANGFGARRSAEATATSRGRARTCREKSRRLRAARPSASGARAPGGPPMAPSLPGVRAEVWIWRWSALGRQSRVGLRCRCIESSLALRRWRGLCLGLPRFMHQDDKWSKQIKSKRRSALRLRLSNACRSEPDAGGATHSAQGRRVGMHLWHRCASFPGIIARSEFCGADVEAPGSAMPIRGIWELATECVCSRSSPMRHPGFAELRTRIAAMRQQRQRLMIGHSQGPGVEEHLGAHFAPYSRHRVESP